MTVVAAKRYFDDNKWYELYPLYNESASFIDFFIEQYGIDNFLKLYRSTDIENPMSPLREKLWIS